MTQEHPITPPPELVKQWAKQMLAPEGENLAMDFDWFATQAARWGADQELEACCADLQMVLGPNQANWLRSVRRPKPPSLKDQALAVLDDASDRLDAAHENIIRRALEQLDD